MESRVISTHTSIYITDYSTLSLYARSGSNCGLSCFTRMALSLERIAWTPIYGNHDLSLALIDEAQEVIVLSMPSRYSIIGGIGPMVYGCCVQRRWSVSGLGGGDAKIGGGVKCDHGAKTVYVYLLTSSILQLMVYCKFISLDPKLTGNEASPYTCE